MASSPPGLPPGVVVNSEQASGWGRTGKAVAVTALWTWTCAVAVELTFLGPPDGLRSPPTIFTGYRNSHLRLDGLEDLDCFAIVGELDRDPLRRGETGHVRMDVRLPEEPADRLDHVLRVGNRFRLLHVGYCIATGTITALLDPPTHLPA
jgi:hypothetical protein